MQRRAKGSSDKGRSGAYSSMNVQEAADMNMMITEVLEQKKLFPTEVD